MGILGIKAITMDKKKETEGMDILKQANIEMEMCLETHQKLSEAEMDEIKKHIHIKTFEKGTILLREGEYSDRCYYNYKGCIRQYYLVDGEDKTTFFYSEGQTIFAPSILNDPSPSKYFLECIEETTVSITSPESESIIFKKIPKFEPMARAAMFEELRKYQEMLAAHIMSTPEQRYKELLEERPELLNKVPHYHLASYLGVKPESLSRIRKRIMQKQV